jgi:hypothetical protein
MLNAWAFKYNLIRDLRVLIQQEMVHCRKALLGVNQMSDLASNTVTKHIVDTGVMMNKKYAN